eukprot:COSAG01_NODE_646_length_14556_cov_9.736806_1_plen_162_part_10
MGNFVAAFVIFWGIWAVALYVGFSQALPSLVHPLIYALLPVVAEALLRAAVWQRVATPARGFLHPRIASAVDLLLGVVSAWTGPIKTVGRLISAFVCMLAHLYRSDITLMLDQRCLALDPHFRASLGVLAEYRVQCEFAKVQHCMHTHHHQNRRAVTEIPPA